MFKAIVSFLIICSSSLTWGQISVDANTLFENYEFELAAKAFEAKSGRLKLETKEKLAFCYFRTDNFNKGLPLMEELLKKDSTAGNYWYWKASLEKEKGEYAKAGQSFRKVKQYDNSYDVDILIASCDAIPTWTSIPRAEKALLPYNDIWANNYTILNNQFYHYYEHGKDSASNDLNVSSASNSFTELFLMKAFTTSGGTSPLFNDVKVASSSLSSVSNIAADGKLYFSANDPIAQDNLSHIFIGSLDENGKISQTEIFTELSGISDSFAFAHPAITSDGNTMIFTKMGYNTNGSDLYISEKQTDGWSTPKPLDFLNTAMDEMFPKIIGDSLLTFSSDGRVGYGDLDIYSIPLSEIESGNSPEHLKAPINSTGDDFNLEWTSDTTAYFVSNRKEGTGDDDVYELLVKKEILPVPVVVKTDTAFHNWFTKWNNQKIYFDYDKQESEMIPELIAGLTKYADNKGMTIQLTGHTDSNGPSEYNQKLGQRRADWFKSELTSAGIVPTIISTSSVGETQQVNDCGNGKNCDDTKRRLNRFVAIEFIRIETLQNTTHSNL